MERMPCEFFLIRYVPDVVKGEFVNIGVLLREAASGLGEGVAVGARAQIRFTRDWARVRCMDAEADTGLLEALEGEIAERLRMGVSARDPKTVMEVLQDSLSNSVQMTEARAVLAVNLQAELDQLMRMYVEPMKVPRVRGVKSGRALLTAALRTEFEDAGVWGLMRKRISAAAYTRAGDPLKVDCGYRAENGAKVIRMFHAVSLAGEVEAAKGLAFTAPWLREGVERVEGAACEMTAVVEAIGSLEEEDARERYRFGVETMEREAIRVVTLGDLARVAETARRELGL